jgi:DNA polymerase-3 subunit alpha
VLFAAVEEALDFGHKAQNSKLTSENSLFGDMEDVKVTEPELPKVPLWSQKERLAREREVIGFYVTGHPLSNYELEYNSFATIKLGEAELLEEDDSVRACGVITTLKTKIDKSGRTMAFFTIDDFNGSCECLMFAKVYEKYGQFIKEEECVFINGKPESSGDAIKIHIDEVVPLSNAREKFAQSVQIKVDKQKNKPENFIELKNILSKNKGKIPLYVHLANNGSKERLFFLKDFKVQLTDSFIDSVSKLFGENSVSLSKK